jgi:hypothetical protein
LKSTHIDFSATNAIALSPILYNKNLLSNMRSQIILALLTTAVIAAPVLTTGDAKVCSLLEYNMHRLMPLR